MNGIYDRAPKAVIEARPVAIRFAQEIMRLANKKFSGNAGMMGGLIASLTLQNIVVSICLHLHKPGSAEGEAEIRKVFEAATRDAVERWHARDLKAAKLPEEDNGLS